MKPKNIAFILYSLGVIIGICGAAKVPVAGTTWPDTVPWFVTGAVVCLIGLVWWRISIRTKPAAAGSGPDESVTSLFKHLRDCRDDAQKIGSDIAEVDLDKLREQIDELMINHLTPFADNRFTLIAHYGMKIGAEVILKAAHAERNFNRVWSAAADMHRPETLESFDTAMASMDDLLAYVDSI